MESPIATLQIVEVKPDGSRIPLRVEIGQPESENDGTWKCLISVGGETSGEKPVYGGDSFQALCFCMQLIRVHLECVLRRGSRLVYFDESPGVGIDVDFPLLAYFGTTASGRIGPAT